MVESNIMQRFLVWLGNLLFGAQPKQEEKALHKTQRSMVAQQLRRRTAVMSGAAQPRSRPAPAAEAGPESGPHYRIEDGGPGKNVLVASGDHTDLVDQLSIVDNSEDGGNGSEFDPYNTGRFDRSSSWSRVKRH